VPLSLRYAIVAKNFFILAKILLFEKIYRKDVTILLHAPRLPAGRDYADKADSPP
jgi:hypothetical protein